MVSSSKVVRRLSLILGIAMIPLLLVAAVLVFSRNEADASSHREAPMISKDAFADNTDTYVFVSPQNPNNLVLVASWIPFEGPEGGPNYWEWDDTVAYDIYVDVDGDATSEVTYTLTSKVMVGNPNTFLYNVGPIGSLMDADWNRRQVYTVTEYFEPGVQPANSARASTNHTTTLIAGKLAAPVNIGSKSTPDYAKLESEAIYEYSDDNGDKIKVFAGQTDDPFFVDLQVFDLLTLRGQAAPVGYTEGGNVPVDSLSGFNVHTLVVEVPISRLVRNGDPVVGVWSGSRRAGMNVMSAGTDDHTLTRQVSRLGMPLVNEVVLPMGLKDTFNSLKPSQDLGAYGLLQESVEDPEVGNLLCGLYKIPLPGDADKDCDTAYTAGSPRTGRGDIFDIFLTGMVLANPFTITTKSGPMPLPAGFNVNRPKNAAITSPVPGVTPAEMIRINTAIKGDLCNPTPSRLGILGGDACGFPNGRRLADDVVEIELLAVAGAAYEVLDDRDASFKFNNAFIPVLSDNIDKNDMPFRNTFPYVAQAQSGQSHAHQNSLVGVFLLWLMKDQ